MTPTAAAACPAGVPVVVAGVMSDNNKERGATMAQNTNTTTKVTPAEKLAERAKRTEAKAAEARARAEAQAEKAAKAQAAAEQAEIKAAEREIAEAAKRAEAERVEEHLMTGWGALCRLLEAEAEGLVQAVAEAWTLGYHLAEAGVKARPAAISYMGAMEWDEVKAKAEAEGKQAQPRYLSKVNDSVNVHKQYPTFDAAVDAAREWAAGEPASCSLRSFVKGESVNKAKKKGDPMTAKAAAALFAKAAARDGLTEDQAWALISEAMENVAE